MPSPLRTPWISRGWTPAGGQYIALTYSFSYLEPVCCSLSSSNCCFLTCIQVSQETGQVVWYSHLFQNFPQSVVIHRVKGFGIVNKAEIDVFLELSCFFNNPADAGHPPGKPYGKPRVLEGQGMRQMPNL